MFLDFGNILQKIDLSRLLHLDPQELSEEDKAQARKNIGAATEAADVSRVLNDMPVLQRDTESLNALVDRAGDHTAISYSAEENYKICGRPTIIYGAGVPGIDTIPDQRGVPAFVGQIYINTAVDSKGLYYAVNTNSVSDWRNA